jgi:hypothetical protein
LSEEQVLDRLIDIVRSKQAESNSVERSHSYPIECSPKDEPEVGNGVA